jgi:phosphinothricin acetyltransferase
MPDPSIDQVAVRAAALSDATAIAAIYNRYIRESVVSFEEQVVPASEIARRIEAVWGASLPWLLSRTLVG